MITEKSPRLESCLPASLEPGIVENAAILL